MSPLDPSVVAKTPAPGVDPWGNEFQVALRQDADGNRTYGVYSLGRDGESASGGNDPDDINSWSLDPVAFYIPELVQELKLSRALWAIPWLLIVYPLMFILLRTRKVPG
ncbi:type II secretion system protein GspG [Stieleria maiorica]|uniref:type II secretion system protein GspG n=1 Tax=Stieleria maiorica TaxID=2795974 RepID=UPI0011CC1403